MADQTINIADLIKPKFEAGQDVFAFERDHRGRITSVVPRRITLIRFTIDINHNISGHGRPTVTRSQNLRYFTAGAGVHEYPEDQLVASLDELPAHDRMPNVG